MRNTVTRTHFSMMVLSKNSQDLLVAVKQDIYLCLVTRKINP